MKNLFSKSIVVTTAALTAVVPFLASAQSPKVQAARDAVELQAQKNAAVVEDTASRIASLKTIVRLTQSEAQDAVAKLKLLLNDGDLHIAAAAEDLLLRANALVLYTELLNRQIAADTTDEEVAAIAAALKVWRQDVFDAVIKQSLDLALIKQGSDGLLAALRRLDKVGLDVSLLQKSLGEPAKVLLPRMDVATKLLARAQASYQKAKGVFAEAQDELHAQAATQAFLKPMTLERSDRGDFISCLPKRIENDPQKQCQAAYRTSSDTYYLLMNANGSAPFTAISGVYRVTGPAVILEPVFGDEVIVGALLVSEVNRAAPLTNDPIPAANEAGANVLSTILESARPTVQSLIKAELADIKSAYNEFVAMLNLTKQLLGKK